MSTLRRIPKQRRVALCNDDGHCIDIGDDVLQEMLDTAAATKQEELGFFTCWKDGQERSGEFCSGDSCSVAIYDCEGAPRVGGFHTHPRGNHPAAQLDCTESSFSDQDLLFTLWEDLRYFCVSGPDTQYVTCWKPGAPAPRLSFTGLKLFVQGLSLRMRPIIDSFVDNMPGVPERTVISWQAAPSPACDDPAIDEAGGWVEDGLRQFFYPQDARNMARDFKADVGTFVTVTKAQIEAYLAQSELPPAEPEPPVVPSEGMVDCETQYTRHVLANMARRYGVSSAGNKRELCERLVEYGVL